MASKFGLVGGLPERRVRPIWDAIDSRQYKNALKLSTALLTKYPKSPYALALKALIVERMGKVEEALSVCLNAKEVLYTSDALLIDDITLSTLQIVFQRLDHLDMATNCYEYACGKFPNNLELMMGLFNCYVREYSFVKQQQIAIKMYKIVGEERFLLWAVCSIQLQVYCGSGEEKLLLLAEGLLKKHIASHSLHEPEALNVYISLLEQQEKFGDALEILSGKLGSLIMIEVEKLRLEGRLLGKAGDSVAAANIFEKVLELCPDDWDSFEHYLGCLLEDDYNYIEGANYGEIRTLESKNIRLSDEIFESRMLRASTLMENILKDSKNDSLRCPYLANLEIERKKILYGKGQAEKLEEALMQYFFRFGHLACFTSDIEPYLQVLENEKKSEFVKKLMERSESSTDLSTKALGQSITIFKVQNSIGNLFDLPIKDLENLAVKMTEMFCKNLPLSKNLDAQENMHGEELLSMACNVLVQLFWRTSDIGYLLESIMILEFGLTLGRNVWQYNILLLHLYTHWDALPLAYERYKALDVKNILVETVSHLILPQMLASPLWADLDYLLGDYLRFMDDHLRESADLTFLAYRHRNYSKVIEFVQFKERLQRSAQYMLAKVEAPILQLKQNANNIEEEERILGSLKDGVHFAEVSSEIGSKSLSFNEDLQLRPWWTPTYDKNYLLGPFEGVSYCPRENLQNQIKQAEANALKNIEKRSLLPRIIYLSIQCASSSVKENIEANGSAIEHKFSSELKTLLEHYAQILGFPFQDAIKLVFEASTGQNSLEVLNSNVIDWMNFVVFLNVWNLNSHEVKDTWKLVNTLLQKMILEKVKITGPIVTNPGSELSILVQLITETLAWHSLILQSCVRSLVPSGKKKKKSGSASDQLLTSNLSHEIQDSIICLYEIINEVSKWLNSQIEKSDDEKLEFMLSSLNKDGGPGKTFRVIEATVSSLDNIELSDRMAQAMQSWSHADVARNLITGQKNELSKLVKICEAKAKSLQGLKLKL